MAEVYFDVELFLKLSVADEQDIVVPRYRFHFRKAFFHSRNPIFQRANRNRENLLQKRVAEFPVGVYQEESFSVFPRRDEVSLHIAHTLFRVDNPRSFVDGSFVFDSGMYPLSSSSFPCEFLAMSLDPSSVRTRDVCSDSHSRDGWQVFVVLPYTLCGQFRRLVVEQVRFHRLP